MWCMQIQEYCVVPFVVKKINFTDGTNTDNSTILKHVFMINKNLKQGVSSQQYYILKLFLH